MATITLTGNYGQTQYVVSNLALNTTIDASTASWTLDSSSTDGDGTNPRPFRVYDSVGTYIKGGTTNGEISLTDDWVDIYYPNGYSAGANNASAVWLERTSSATIKDWRITNTWDGITIGAGADNFVIEDIWMTDVRDDAIENDKSLSGTIRDTLIDGAFVGIATDGSQNGSANKMVIDGLLLRMENYLFTHTGRTGDDAYTHSSPFKTNGSGLEYTPRMEIKNSIIAIERVDHDGLSRLREAWTNVTVSENNYYLNLSDTPLPSTYPMPPAGWTVLQGQAARDYWNNARDTWLARHDTVDEMPVAVNDTYAATEDTTLTVSAANGVLKNDTAADGGKAAVAGTKTTVNGGSFQIAADGSFTYVPAKDFFGQDSVTYTVRDTDGDLDTGTVTFNVADVAEAGQTIIGTSGADNLPGTAYADTIDGRAGNDMIYGRDGNDRLTGGTGADTFTFDTALSATNNVDVITDFLASDDLMRVNDSVFTGLTVGSLPSSAFVLGTKAADSSDRIIYDRTTGSLYFDRDGTGSAAQIKFAELTSKPSVTYADFIVI